MSEIECSICLEKIEEPNTLVKNDAVTNDDKPGEKNEDNGVEQKPEESGIVTHLPCNAMHMFHPNCIKMWLNKGSACPLCKFNPFTGKLDTETNNNNSNQAAEEPAMSIATSAQVVQNNDNDANL